MDVRFIILNCKKYIFVADFSLNDWDIALGSLRIYPKLLNCQQLFLHFKTKNFEFLLSLGCIKFFKSHTATTKRPPNGPALAGHKFPQPPVAVWDCDIIIYWTLFYQISTSWSSISWIYLSSIPVPLLKHFFVAFIGHVFISPIPRQAAGGTSGRLTPAH